jgi:carbonic anhydrase
MFIALVFLGFFGCSSQEPKSKEIDTTDPLQKLIEGNKRFSKGKFNNNRSKDLLSELSNAQNPYAVVVCCSDSRISPNVLFDTDFGDLFIIRTAGNILGEVDLASIEYAIEHLKTPLLVIMGHSNCGAVTAFVKKEPLHGHIKTLADSLSNEPEEQALVNMHDDNLDHYIRANVIHQANFIKKNSEIIKKHLENQKLIIKESYLDTKTGIISYN